MRGSCDQNRYSPRWVPDSLRLCHSLPRNPSVPHRQQRHGACALNIPYRLADSCGHGSNIFHRPTSLWRNHAILNTTCSSNMPSSLMRMRFPDQPLPVPSYQRRWSFHQFLGSQRWQKSSEYPNPRLHRNMDMWKDQYPHDYQQFHHNQAFRLYRAFQHHRHCLENQGSCHARGFPRYLSFRQDQNYLQNQDLRQYHDFRQDQALHQDQPPQIGNIHVFHNISV